MLKRNAAFNAALTQQVVDEYLAALGGNSRDRRLLAADKLTAILDGFEPSDVYRFDCFLRPQLFRHPKEIGRRQYFDTAMSPKERSLALIIASCDPDGHIRQRAATQLCDYPATLPFIALRTNDWVREVRISALASLGKAMQIASDAELLRSLPMFLRMSFGRRGSFSSALELLKGEFGRRPEFIGLALQSECAETRKFCATYLVTEKDIEEVFRQYPHERELHIRRMYAKLMLRCDPAGAADMLLRDKYPAIVCQTLNRLYVLSPAAALEQAKLLLCSPNGSVRSLAQYIVTHSQPDFDLREAYLAQLSAASVRTLAGCICGLGECQCASDCALIEPFLCHERPSVVQAAMGALMWLDSKRYSAVITDLLSSPASGTAKTAAQLLWKHRCIDYERILQLFSSSTSEALKFRCASLLLTAGKWQRLVYLLTMVDDACDAVRELCARRLDAWLATFNRSFAKPSSAQLEQIKRLLAKAERLPESFRAEIEFLLQTEG